MSRSSLEADAKGWLVIQTVEIERLKRGMLPQDNSAGDAGVAPTS